MGTWKITAHYEDDEANAVSREFKVQTFGKQILWMYFPFSFQPPPQSLQSKNIVLLLPPVLPSFEVNINMKQSYILMNEEEIVLTISAM